MSQQKTQKVSQESPDPSSENENQSGSEPQSESRDMSEKSGKLGIFDYLTLALAVVADNKNSLINLLVGLIVVALERLSTLGVFQCPCYDDAKTGSFWYGMSFLIAPAIAFLIVGYLMDPLTTRMLTGLSRRKKKSYLARSQTIFSIFVSSSMAPIVWLSIGFLDGRYYSCAMTPQPYLNSCALVYQGKNTFSHDFQLNLVKSQIIGWAMIAISFILVAVTFSFRTYMTAVSHWQKKFISMTNQIEREEFEIVAETKIRKDTKTNLGKFLKKDRCKEDWDKATELFPVTGRCCQNQGYSSLQEWCRMHHSPMQSQQDITANGEPANDDCGCAGESGRELNRMEQSV